MYEEVILKCDYCRGTGIGEYVTEYGPWGREVKDTCHECEGEGTIIKLVEYEIEDED